VFKDGNSPVTCFLRVESVGRATSDENKDAKNHGMKAHSRVVRVEVAEFHLH
jgi:hypothetical protein